MGKTQLEITIKDSELWNRAVDKAHDEGTTIDAVIESLLEKYTDDDPEPEAVPA